MEKKTNSQIYVAASIIVSLIVIWYSIDVFLLIFASILLAILLSALGAPLSQKLKAPPTLSISVVILSFIGIFTLFISLLVPIVNDQISQLAEDLPKAWDQISENVKSYLRWKPISAIASHPADLFPKNKDIIIKASDLFSTTFGAIGSFIIFLFIGIFLAYAPKTYINGVLKLIPLKKRARASETLDEIAKALRWWLIGKFFSMALVGISTSIGLWILGVPLAITLGLIAAFLTFIPNIGPILAAVPAILIAASQSIDSAIYVVLLYTGIQSLESYVITPAIQQEVVSLPPALTISAQLLMAVLTGSLGLALAAPLTAALMVLIKNLYVEDILNDYEEQK